MLEPYTFLTMQKGITQLNGMHACVAGRPRGGGWRPSK